MRSCCASSWVAAPATSSSLPSRSWKVPKTRSILPLAWGECAVMERISSSARARLTCLAEVLLPSCSSVVAFWLAGGMKILCRSWSRAANAVERGSDSSGWGNSLGVLAGEIAGVSHSRQVTRNGKAVWMASKRISTQLMRKRTTSAVMVPDPRSWVNATTTDTNAATRSGRGGRCTYRQSP